MSSDGPSLRDNLDRLIGIVRRSMKFVWLGALIAAAGGAATLAFAMNRSRTYVSETVILYREIIPTNMIRAPGSTSSNRSLSIRFREVLFSRPLLEKAVTENGLYPDLVGAGDIDEAIELVRDAIKFRDRGGDTFRISYQGRTPSEAQKVTESLAKLLLQWEKDVQLEAVTITREFFAAERERADLELSGAEYVLAQFLSEHPEFALDTKPAGSGSGGSTVGTSIRAKQVTGNDTPRPIAVARPRVSSPELRALERQRDRLTQRLGQLAVKRDPRPARASPELEKARRDHERAVENLAELQSRFTDRHPDVIRARARVSAAKSLLDSLESERPTPSTEDSTAERATLTSQLAEVDQQLAQLRQRLRAIASANQPKTTPPKKKKDDGGAYIVELEAEHARLVRRVNEARERYRTIESKWHTSELSAASEIARQGTQLTIIDPAYKPMRPAGAPTKLLLAFGGMASLGLAFVVVLALGSLDDRIFSPGDLAQLDAGPIDIDIPKLGKSPFKAKHG